MDKAKSVKSEIGMKKKGIPVLLELSKFGLYLEQIVNCDLENSVLLDFLGRDLNKRSSQALT